MKAVKRKPRSKEAKEKAAYSRLTFKNPLHWVHLDGRTFIGNHKDLRDNMTTDNLAIGALVKVGRKEAKQHKGWKIEWK